MAKKISKKRKPAKKYNRKQNDYASRFLFWGFVCAILVAAVITGYVYSMTNKPCPIDAKVCPDGTTVGRVGPHCQFDACPLPTQQ